MQEGTVAEEGSKGRQQLQTTRSRTRKSFKTIQNVATDKENLTGRPIMAKDKKPDVAIERKNSKDARCADKGVQANVKFTVEDLTSDAGPSEDYWLVVAEKRRIALEETLEENRQLHEKIEALEEENKMLRSMVDESKSLVDVLTEMIDEKQEESGIDLGEASTVSINEDSEETEKKKERKK